jgi:hypothetical protein
MPCRLAKALMLPSCSIAALSKRTTLVIQYEHVTSNIALGEQRGNFRLECDWTFSGQGPHRPQAFAGDGKHNSTIPKPRRVRSRNDIRVLIRMAMQRVESQNLTGPREESPKPYRKHPSLMVANQLK